MRDKKLFFLILLTGFLFAVHTADHAARGDLRWPLTAQSIPFILVTLAIFAVVAGGLYLYRRGTIGPRFWAIFAAIGIALGWLGHLSPFAGQPPQVIFHAYHSAATGSLAVAALVALMRALNGTAVYAGVLWARQRK